MKYFVPVILVLVCLENIFPQVQDSVFIGTADSLLAAPDTLASPDTMRRGYDLDTVVYSSASDSIVFLLNQKKMNIFGSAELQYKDTELKSANIFIDFSTNDVHAEGAKSDTSEGLVGTPVLKEKGETYEGVTMKYNFRTARGYITAAGTVSEGAYYTGSKIKKVDAETYFIQDGLFTSCEIDTPHYHFYSPEMKVIHKEQIITKWVWLFFGGVPFPVPLPFAVFPIESGRRSGILAPTFGSNGTYGRYFSRFGYFWAINDYMDINVTGDYYTRGSYGANSRFRYVKRYNLSGNLEGGYSYFEQGEITDPNRDERADWRIRWNHNQNIDPTLRFDANLEFLSGNYLNRNVTDYSELLRNDVTSNATVFKSWEESGNSLSLSYSRTQSLETGNITEELPNLTFNMSQKYPFRRKGSVGEQSWYEMIGYTYNSQFRNSRIKRDGNLNTRGGIQHNINVNASPKIGYFNITPRISYNERWYNKRIERFVVEDSLIQNDVKEINMVRTFGLGVTTSTKFYGMFQPGVLGVAALRHTVNPTISYDYQPDFSKPHWGYYDTYTAPDGRIVKYSKFQEEVFRGPEAQERQSISLSIANIFEIKTSVDPSDTTSKEQKIQLLNLQASTGYNLAADSFHVAPLNLSYRTQIGEYFNFSGNSTFTPYDYNEERTISSFLSESGRGLLRMTNFSFSVSTNISGERIKSALGSRRDTIPESEFELGSAENSVYRGLYDERDADFTIPWDVSLTYTFNQNQPIPSQIIRSSTVGGGMNFNLTPNWKFSFSGSYDLVRGELAAPQIRVSRDLHCWLMNFTWNPIGRYYGYRFEIRVKAPQLQDLKLTKRGDFFSGK